MRWPPSRPVLDELDLILIDPLPSYHWYQDMADFADGISDRGAGERLRRCLGGKDAFRRFRNDLYQRNPELISTWHGTPSRAEPGRANNCSYVPPGRLAAITACLARHPRACAGPGTRRAAPGALG